MGKVANKLKNRRQKSSGEINRAAPVSSGDDKIFPDIPFSPAGFLIFLWVLFLDLLGLFFGAINIFAPTVGEWFSLIPDIMGLMTVGVYDWFKMGKMPIGPKLKRYLTKRGGARFIFEVLPTGFLPLWTVYAFKKSKKFPDAITIEDELEYENT